MAKIMTYAEAINGTITEEMRRDPTIFTYSHNVTYGGANKENLEEFGSERMAFSGICETQEAGAGVGAALVGMRPIVNLGMADWALDAFWQVTVQATKMRFKLAYKLDCPVVFKLSVGGSTVHHSSRCHNWFANSPNMFVAIPTTPADAVGLWRTALRETKDPVAMLETRGIPEGPVPEGDYTIPFGKADIKREGIDVTIAAVGAMVPLALEATEDLAKEGIDVEVWDPRTLTPFDRESLIKSVKKTGAMVIVDDAPKSFGTTGEFAITVAEAMDPIPPMARVAMMDAPVAFGILQEYVVPNKNKVISAVKGVLRRKG